MLLRRSGSASSVAAHAAPVGLCVVAVGLSSPHTMRVLAHPRRSFFTAGSPGSDLLRHFTSSPAEPTKAFSPLDKLRPPAPPSASDAQPFGSLNRTNQLRRYVNVNTDSVTPNGTTSTTVGNSNSSNTSPAGGAAGASAAATSSHSQMDLSRLVRRHASSPVSPAPSSAPSAAANASRCATAAAAPETTSPSSSAPTPAAPVVRVGGAAVTSTHATVAKAQAAIAAAQLQQQSNVRGEETRRSDTANTAHTPSSSSSPLSSAPARATHATPSPRQHSQVYKEHCYIGWSPEEFYRVVADVEHYTDFLPWCAGSEVHTARRVRVPRGSRLLAGNQTSQSTPTSEAAVATPCSPTEGAVAGDAALTREAVEAELVDAIAMTATLTIGFSFLKEQYTSRVTLYPGTKIVAALYDDDDADATATAAAATATPGGVRASPPPSRPSATDSFVVSLFKKAASTAGAAAKRSILKHLLCEWEFCPVPGKPNMVEVVFSVSFEFKNPLHSHMIMSNVVTLMTRSFERRCESLYGPPSASKESLPLFF